MYRVLDWCKKTSKQLRNSFLYSISITGVISTILTISGFSLESLGAVKLWMRILIALCIYVLSFIASYLIIARRYKDSVNLLINNTKISILYGDLFNASGWRVIGCDTHFSTIVDDVVISKNSLHGQFLLNHANRFEIDSLVKSEAEKRNLKKNHNGFYDFKLGTIIRYDSSVDGGTYLLLAMTELNKKNESHTNMVKYESMLMTMWDEISRIYASHEIALPLLGFGITRFDNGPKTVNALLRCMLCTLNSTALQFNANIKIILDEGLKDKENISLYEYKNMFLNDKTGGL